MPIMLRISSLVFLILILSCKDVTEDVEENFVTPFEKSKGLETATYQETIDFYMELAREFPQIHIQTIGETDSDYPLHIVTFNKGADFNYQKLAENHSIILINNGIHPGESDGIDATMMFFRDLAQGNLKPPDSVVINTIPIYNVGGSLNRSGKTRVNQNGPDKYGFRGNSRNYDLNRDFIKCDTRNSRTFTEIFHLLQPDIFIDNHVSNGADYQYTLSHLFTQHNKLGEPLGEFVEDDMIPSMEKALEVAGWPVTPYVNLYNKPPDQGFSQFFDLPRYSTGYAALWNTPGLMIETHMLKPYKERVTVTYEFLLLTVKYVEAKHGAIKSLREASRQVQQEWTSYPLKWEIDSTKIRTLNFKGYQADTILSLVTGRDRLKYLQDKPYTREIPYFNHFRPADSVEIPSSYVIGKQWRRVLDLLDLNGISYTSLQNDTIIEVESYRIKDYRTSPYAYEGHYPHYNTEVEKTITNQNFLEGDIVIPTDQPGMRYLLEVFEPAATDSFFNWNFFDTILQQKEGFSPYVFEDLALKLLESNRELRDSFELKKAEDDFFREDPQAQLQWIYQQSDFYESAHLQYPVYRILK